MAGRKKRVYTFSKGICPKANIIARLEFELAYYDSAVHCFNHYTMRTPPTHAQRERERERQTERERERERERVIIPLVT